jgi:hypothetical protein
MTTVSWRPAARKRANVAIDRSAALVADGGPGLMVPLEFKGLGFTQM